MIEQQILIYLQSHPDRLVTLKELADHCGYSVFHFQRLCKAHFGVGPGKLAELIRLQRGYYLLRFRPWLSITDIALKCGYQSVEGFSRAFKRATGFTPQAFKRDLPTIAGPLNQHLLTKENRETMHADNEQLAASAELVTMAERTVCALRYRGHPARLTATIQQFINWRRENRLPPSLFRTFNFFYNDPNEVSPDEFYVDVACEIPRRPLANLDDKHFVMIPSGTYARVTVMGGDSYIEQAANFLIGHFIPQQRHTPADFPLIVERVTFYPEVPVHQAKSYIYLLLR